MHTKKNYGTLMKSKATEELEILYEARCMLTDYRDRLTYHHNIEKRCEGGKETIRNGALLNIEAHGFLNKIEQKKPELYNDICDGLQLYKKCVDEGLTDCLQEWEVVQEQFVKRMKRGAE